jgi:outer membrane receptor protein involved in Fe transport
VLGYLVAYRLSLFSNFTFFARDPVRGDMIEQTDARTMAGFRASQRLRHRLGGWQFETTAGAQLRVDAIENALYHDQARVRFETVNHSAIRQSSIGVFAQEEIEPARWLRLILGARADLFSFAVEDLRRGPMLPDPGASGVRQALIASPKATLVLSPAQALDLYLNFGTGFHSNDARGVVRPRDPVTPLARAVGYELGSRVRLLQGMEWSLALWGLDLESEIVWVGDEGSTEARGPTRRLGATLEGRWDLTSWMRADVDVSLVHAVFTQSPDNANAVPLAPPVTAAAGVQFRHPAGPFGALRLRAVSDRPATEDRALTAQGFAVFSAQAGYRGRCFELAVSAENLLNTPWREAQFANETRLRSEPAPVADLHFTPGTPFAANARLTLFL